MRKILHYLIHKHIAMHDKKIPFTVFVYFFTTFVLLRVFIYAWTYGYIPEISVVIKGIEIHHLSYGIFILAIVGYWSLVNKKEETRVKIAKIYGIGLALAFDEFGMWLHLENNYWLRQSYDAIIIITAWLLNAIYLTPIWKKIFKQEILLGKKLLNKFLHKPKLK
jgi:hypothetical protein